MKRIFTILTIVLMSTVLTMAETVKIGQFYYSLGATTATLVKDQSSGQTEYKEYINITIPANVTYNNYTYPVITIGISAFEYCTNLQSVTLPSSITTINTDAFYGCSKLGSVNLPEGLTTINKRAFYNCNLTSLIIPSTVTSVGENVFSGNPLKSVVWKPVNCSVYTGSYAPFNNSVSQLTDFTFGDQVETVPGYLCNGMSKVEEISLPATVTSVGTYAFYNCSNLQAIHNYAIEPQTITERAVNNVNKQTCILYVPIDYIDLYKAKAVWCNFLNIVGVATELQFEEQIVNLSYFNKDGSLLYMDAQTWEVPHAPYIEGFTFEKWEVMAGDLNDGIKLQAVYKADTGTGAPAHYLNPANPAQKLIRRGNVYVLQDGKTYSVHGSRVE